MRLFAKLLILIPYFYLSYILISSRGLGWDYFSGFLGLVVLGLLGVLFDINLILSKIYILLGFGLYCYFYDHNIYNLWPVGGLLLVQKVSAKKRDKVVFNKKPINKKSIEEKPVVVEKKSVEKEKPVLDDVWARYDSRRGSAKLVDKLKGKFNKSYQKN